MPKYPNIEVELVGQDGNAFFIIGRVASALRRGRVAQSEIDEFTNEAMSGDYSNVLATAMKWVNCFPGDEEWLDEDGNAYTDDDYLDEDDEGDSCDRCPAYVANGEGHYPDDESGDRVCAVCATEIEEYEASA